MNVNFFQQGGPMGPPPAEGGSGDPMEQLVAMAAQALKSNDPNMAMQVCQALLELTGQAEPQGPPEGGEGPAPEEGGEPVFRHGGKLIRRIR